jgi:leucine dehydrogenase
MTSAALIPPTLSNNAPELASSSKMQLFDTIAEMGHEQVVVCHDRASGYRGIIAIHDTTLGPALGGTRFWHYGTDAEAIVDALRLSRGMTYKNAVAGLNLGGGKSVIIGDNRTPNREMIFRAHGRFVDSLGGRYVTAEDVGTSTGDMDFVHMETDYVAGLAGASGDPSPVTAHGVFRAIQASACAAGARLARGEDRAIQGCGNVGHHLARSCTRRAHARRDRHRPERVKRVTTRRRPGRGDRRDLRPAGRHLRALRARRVINDQTLPQLRCEIVAGAANNQLLEDRHGEELEAKGILYAPDYVANAGGVINVYSELAGWSRERSLRKADEIYHTVLNVFEIAKQDGIPTYRAADRLAERRIAAVRSMVKTWPQWPNKAS